MATNYNDTFLDANNPGIPEFNHTNDGPDPDLNRFDDDGGACHSCNGDGDEVAVNLPLVSGE